MDHFRDVFIEWNFEVMHMVSCALLATPSIGILYQLNTIR